MKKWKIADRLKCTYIPTTQKEYMVSLVVNIGSKQDGELQGLAHFTEHMLLKSIIKAKCDIYICGTTDFDKTVFTFKCPNLVQLSYAFNIIVSFFKKINFDISSFHETNIEVRQELADSKPSPLMQYLMKVSNLSTFLPVGNFTGIGKINLADIERFHRNYLLHSESSIVVTGNVNVGYLEASLNAVSNTNIILDNVFPIEKRPFSLHPTYFIIIGKELNICWHSSYTNHIANDIAFCIVEDAIRLYFLEKHSIHINCFISTFVFDENNMFAILNCAEIPILNKQSISIDKLIQSLFEFLNTYIRNADIQKFKDLYVYNFPTTSRASTEVIIANAVNSVAYGASIREESVNLFEIQSLSNSDIMDILMRWFVRNSYKFIIM